MATYTVPATSDNWIGTGTTPPGYLGSSLNPTHQTGPFDPEPDGCDVRLTVDRTATTGGESIATASSDTLPYLGDTIDPIQQTGEFSAEPGFASTVERATVNREGFGGSALALVDGSPPQYLGQYLEGEQRITGLDPTSGEGGSFIPQAYFRRLQGVVVDEEGEPITAADLIYTRDNLPTGGPVDENGRFVINTLRQTYREFVLIADSGRSNVDYGWYQPVDVEVGPQENNVVLTFNTEKISGMVAGGTGTGMGGPLG